MAPKRLLVDQSNFQIESREYRVSKASAYQVHCRRRSSWLKLKLSLRFWLVKNSKWEISTSDDTSSVSTINGEIPRQSVEILLSQTDPRFVGRTRCFYRTAGFGAPVPIENLECCTSLALSEAFFKTVPTPIFVIKALIFSVFRALPSFLISFHKVYITFQHLHYFKKM